MRFRRSAKILFLAFMSALLGFGQARMPDSWVEVRLPPPADWDKENSEAHCANYSKHEWRVEIRPTNKLEVADSAKEKSTGQIAFPPRFVRTKQMVGRTIIVRAGDGWLLGFDAGEFGGGLWWASADGSVTKHLSTKNVHMIIPRGEELLVLTGLAHLVIDEGEVYSFQPALGGASKFNRIADLGSAPQAATYSKGGAMLISTAKSVMELEPDNRLRKLYEEKEHMPWLYPTSIATDQTGAIFVGMRFYVLRLSPRDSQLYNASWFVPSDCTKTKIQGFDCLCVGNVTQK
jgi:hypothetical protein